jgi:hypothetical protein
MLLSVRDTYAASALVALFSISYDQLHLLQPASLDDASRSRLLLYGKDRCPLTHELVGIGQRERKRHDSIYTKTSSLKSVIYGILYEHHTTTHSKDSNPERSSSSA